MSAGIGHNMGPAMDRGVAARRFAWTRARADLLPRSLPIEIVRRRVARARDLGLDYRSYASVRASTGRDVIGFLFSGNALRLLKAGEGLPADRAAKLAPLKATRIALLQGSARPATHDPLDRVALAPPAHAPWPRLRADLAEVLAGQGPAGGFLVVGDGWPETDWVLAARAAGYIAAESYFGT